MEALFFLLKRTAINSIKELRKKPLKLIAYILFLGLLIFAIFNKSKFQGNKLDSGISNFRAMVLAVTIFILFVSIKNGNDRGNNLFRLADVNFLFPAPMTPQKILIYGFIQQLYASILVMGIILFQTPNLYMFFPVKNYAWLIITLGLFILNFFSSVLGILVYAIGSLRERNRKIIRILLYGILGLLSLGLLYSIFEAGDPIVGIQNYSSLKFFNDIPILGWIFNIFNASIYGYTLMTTIYILAMLIVSGLIIYIIYRFNLDYYEDAMDNSITKEEQIAKAKTGNMATGKSNFKLKNIEGEFKYEGAMAILTRQILEAKKKGFIFANFTTLIIGIVSLIYAYFLRKNGIDFLLYMIVYMSLIFSSTSKWAMELNSHYIYLIPEPSIKKIIYATLLENIKGFIVGIVIFIPATFIYKVSLLRGFILALAYTSFIILILYSDLVIRRLLGLKVSLPVERVLKMILVGLSIIPGVILFFTLGTSLSKYFGIYTNYAVLILYNLLISLLYIYLSREIFEKIEIR